ncbi:MAG: Endonuclease YncB [Candidatus Alkanophagales archaeon MCA70_species_2]|nr:Endonuclease YncB [Candidatus Alkanophaga liquidiphilum]
MRVGILLALLLTAFLFAGCIERIGYEQATPSPLEEGTPTSTPALMTPTPPQATPTETAEATPLVTSTTATPPLERHTPNATEGTHTPTPTLPAAQERVRAYVKNVVDGDTIDVELEGGTEERVRLVGVDTPELSGNEPEEYGGIDAGWLDFWGFLVKSFAEGKLMDKHVYLEFDELAGERDKYGRLLAYVILEDGTDFNAELVKEGFARVYVEGEFAKRDEYLAYQETAQDERAGLWYYYEILSALENFTTESF